MGCCASKEGEGSRTVRQWTPLENRGCTDIPWLVIFFLFLAGMIFVAAFSIYTGAASRLIYGYDSYGNLCGTKNTPIQNFPMSGQDMREKPFVFFLDACNLDPVKLKFRSMSLCVSQCPERQLSTMQDVRHFADNNSSSLCDYSVKPADYKDILAGSTCPKLPVPASKPVLHRCVPTNITCFIKFAETVAGVINSNDIFHKVISGIMNSKDVIIGLCFLALVLSIIMMLVIRYISTVLVWILTILLILGSLAGTGVLWWMYAEYRASGNTTLPLPQLPIVKSNEQGLLIYAIIATVFTVILLLIMLVLRSRVKLTIALFHTAGKVFIHMPLLMLQPLWTFIALLIFWVYWIAVLLLLGTAEVPAAPGPAGDPSTTDQGFVEYQLVGPVRYMWWYHLVGLIWVSEFILACQQLAIAGSVVTYYFTRNKSQLPMTPILSSIKRLLLYHLGTVAKGSFIITLVKIPRLVLMYIHQKLKGTENACTNFMLKCCICCLWCLEKCLKYLNQNAYTATAINGTSFCSSARDALTILVSNALRVAAINCVGDFMLFMAKILVVCFTGFAGAFILNYQRDYHMWVVPLLLVCLFAYLVAHCFLSVFEIVVDVLFLCFAVDTEHNDGTPGREYYMDKSLMEYVKNSEEALSNLERKRKEGRASGDAGRELKPMAASNA
ncbi:choline transporter-like protein 1 isoform X1 [Petromyzon marinus]|uniref:Choline transporter-like protein n=1 Tax=Petromyzon marinus TaxID=7757 RepID=A0AAJ7TYX9_PETMA|nr:choline transporter-like protein 1 isoform X1 [Petromyzon marinus]